MNKFLCIKKKRIIFLTAYVLYFTGLIIEHTAALYSSEMKKFVSMISIGCLMFNYLNKPPALKILKKKFGMCIFLLAVSISAVVSKDFFILFLVLFGVNMSSDEEVINDIFKISVILTVFISILTVVLCLRGIIPNLNSARTLGSEERWTYGFEHSQILSLMFLYAVLYYYTYKQKVSIGSFLLFQTIGWCLTDFFDARNAIYSLEIFFIVYFLWKVKTYMLKKTRICASKTIYFIAQHSFGAASAASLLLLFLYMKGNKLVRNIDIILTGRIRYPLKTFSVHPIKLIRIMTFEEYRSLLQSTMDNGYYYIAFRYGIIYLIILSVISWFIIKHFSSRNNIYGSISIITIAISCSIANGFTGCYFYPFWMVAIYEIKKYVKGNMVHRGCKTIRSI